MQQPPGDWIHGCRTPARGVRRDQSRLALTAASFAALALAFYVPASAQAQTIVQQDLALTANHVGPLWIFSNDVVLDCQNFSVIEPNPVDQEQQSTPGNGRAGILLVGVSGVTVQNCYIEDFWFGIRVVSSTGVSLIGNTVTESQQPSAGWTVRDAYRLEASENSALIGNTEADTQGDGFTVVNSRDNLLSGNSGGGGGDGYQLYSAHDNQLLNNDVFGNGGGDGFHIHESNDNQFVANSASGLNTGFRIQTGSSANAIRANAITGNTTGILVCEELRDENTLSPNRFRDNGTDIVEGGISCP